MLVYTNTVGPLWTGYFSGLKCRSLKYRCDGPCRFSELKYQSVERVSLC